MIHMKGLVAATSHMDKIPVLTVYMKELVVRTIQLGLDWLIFDLVVGTSRMNSTEFLVCNHMTRRPYWWSIQKKFFC